MAVVPVAINVSLRQLRDPNFVADWHAAIDAYQLPPHLLEMEVTESCVAEHIDTACAILEDIVALGCAIAIDDYGTGYSSLSYLKRLPISAIKIDRSFIQDLHSDFNDKVSASTPLKRIGAADDIAAAITACATMLGYSTGHIVQVDGGRAL